LFEREQHGADAERAHQLAAPKEAAATVEQGEERQETAKAAKLPLADALLTDSIQLALLGIFCSSTQEQREQSNRRRKRKQQQQKDHIQLSLI